MEFDQILFKKVMEFFDKRKSKNSAEVLMRTVRLEEMSSRLTLIARALTGINIDIAPAESEGGWKNTTFYLPVKFSKLPTLANNLNYYIFRTVYLSIQVEAGFNWPETKVPYSTEDSRKKAAECAPSVLQIMEENYPTVFQFYQYIKQFFDKTDHPDFLLYGKFMTTKDVFENDQNDHFNNEPNKKKSVDISTEIKSKPVEEVEVIKVDKRAQEDYVMTHNFEKVETAEEFSGVWRGFDGDDTLEEDADALNELNLKHLVRTDEVAHSIYQADFRDLAKIAESETLHNDDSHLTYKEWHFSQKKYLPDHCKVFLKRISGGDLTYANKCLSENRKSLEALRRKFAQIHQNRKTIKRLPDGESIDTDCLVDWYTDLKSGRTPNDNIYISKRKKDPDLAVLFLLDMSLSTDGYADNNRVIDVEKQAVILFGEVLSEYQVDFAVCSFYSKTRNNCVYHTLKGFNEKWIKGKQKLGAIAPEGYTRIGPALRHSHTLIENQDARQKWVILLSDGKPNDYDKYEGKYGISDVKQALREMHERHIQTYAIAIESTARYYLPQMFGQNHYNILSHPDMLIDSLAMLYRRINNC